MKQSIALAAALWAAPALAQNAGHEGHDMSGMSMPGMEMPQQPASGADEVAPASPTGHDHHAMHGMTTPSSPPREHTGHAMPEEETAPLPQANPPLEAYSGREYAADAVYPADAMAHARMMMTSEMGGLQTTLIMLDRLEVATGKGDDGWAWEGSIRTGGDIDRLWIKSEGEGALGGSIDDAEVQALWGHAIGPWFDVQAGLRHEMLQGPNRTQLAIGVQGLAPYMFELSAAAFLSTKGELTAKLEAEIDQRLTQRLILQPRIEADISAQDMPDVRTGTGLTTMHAGVRLRYEIRREFAPYIGMEWQRQFGRTARYSRAEGQRADRLVALVGIRAWF